MKSQRINQVEIAERSGVSVATVNRVLSGKTEVSPELSARVQAVASELGYKQRAKKRKEVGATGKGVGLLMDIPEAKFLDEFQNRFFVGVESAMNELKRPLVVASYRDDVLDGRQPMILQHGLVDGLIIKGTGSIEGEREWLDKLATQIPIVTMMYRRHANDIPSVMCDNIGAMYKAIEYLRGLGHSRIGFLSVNDVGLQSNYLHNERLHGFLMHAPELGVKLDDGYVQVLDRDWDKESLADTMGRALDNWLEMKDNRPTAVLCATDVYGMTLMEEATKRGLSLPQDLSVMGVMNTVGCDFTSPPMTSIGLSPCEMGRVAAELLMSRIKNPSASVRHITLGCRIVERQSCQAI